MTLLPPRPLRRLIIGPLAILVAVPLAVVFAVLALVGALTALPGALIRRSAGRRRLLGVAMLGLVYLRLEVTILIGCFALWIRQPGFRRDAARWSQTHCRLLDNALSNLMSAASRWVGFRILVDPNAGEPPPGPLVVVARHAGPGDSFSLVHLVLGRFHRRPRVVLKSVLQWDPALDVILNRLSGHFLPSSSGSGEETADELSRLASMMSAHDALLIFPEGGNWTPRRHQRAIVRLRRAGRPRAADRASRMRHVLPPRPIGALACLAARPDAHVVVVAHTGLDLLVNPRQIWAAIPFTKRPMHVGWWCVQNPFPVSTPDEGERWLTEQWAEVDRWVEARNALPEKNGEPSGLERDPSAGEQQANAPG